MAKRSFDELNILGKSVRNAEIKKEIRDYFEETEMPTERTEKRIAFALALLFAFRKVFEKTLEMFSESLMENITEIKEYAIAEYEKAMEENGLGDFVEEFEKHITASIGQIVDTTVDRLNKYDKTDTSKDVSKEYAVSDARAIVLAETESHSAWSAEELNKAILDGYKTKTWVTMRDKKVRETHTVADKTTIGIYDTFTIGDSELGYPGDITYGPDPKEIVNCRCFLQFNK